MGFIYLYEIELRNFSPLLSVAGEEVEGKR
jgi:hypothetical protein